MREASGVAAGLVALPSGGSAVAPQGDRFQPDLVRGSGSYAVPVHLPKGPNGLAPAMTLSYSTGSGNGPFGLGWRLDVMRIERRSDRGVPRYDDADTFVIGGAEVLVPVGEGRYRPQADTRSWHVERAGDGWRVRTGEGRTLLLGRSPASREARGGEPFAWYVDEESDQAGNAITYGYRRDGDRLFLDEVRYSIFSLRIGYTPRPDVLRNGRAGFLRVTGLRAAGLELHCTRQAPTLMRSWRLHYEQADNGSSLLTRIAQVAERDGEVAAMPELTFAYGSADLDSWQIHEPESLVPPPSLDDPTAQLVDLTGDGLPDVLRVANGRILRWRNTANGRFEGPVAVGDVPSPIALDRETVAFADLNANGRADLFAVNQRLAVAFEADGRGGFSPDPIVFRESPATLLADPRTRLMDVDGDGVIDLIHTGRDHFLLYRHEPRTGWADPVAVQRLTDLERFPDVSLDNPDVRLADMTGDGLQDFVLVRSGDVSYWPYLGNGRWGDRVRMAGAPRLQAGFRHERLHLVDLDGDGCADLVHLDDDAVRIWLNRSGAGFEDEVTIPVTTGMGGGRVLPADLFGDGRPGFVWSAPGRREYSAGYRFLRFAGGHNPYMMTTIDNGLGGTTELTYSTTTAMRRADEDEGRPWPGLLPFVVGVVQTIRESDATTGHQAEVVIRYHDGVYDGPRREFRGFTEVTVDVAGDDSVPATRQEVRFFQGDPEHPDRGERDRQRALAGALLETRQLERVEGTFVRRRRSVQAWEARPQHDAAVHLVLLSSVETTEESPSGEPARIERTTLADYDAFGNVGRRLRESAAGGAVPAAAIRSEERFTYVANETDWLVKLPVRMELRDGTGVPFAVKIHHYDGPAFAGLAEGDATHGLLTRVSELRLLEAKLPAGYVGARDFAGLGLALTGAGDLRGYYATTIAHGRDTRGNVVAYRDPTGNVASVDFDADGVHPVRSVDANGAETTLEFAPHAGEPARVQAPDGRRLRYEHDPLGRLVAAYEDDDTGTEQLVKCWAIDVDAVPTSITSYAPRAAGSTRAELVAADSEALTGVSVARVYLDGGGREALQVTRAADDPGGARRFVRSNHVRLNARGLTASTAAPRLVSTLAFDAAGPATPDGIAFRYDALGRVRETIGPAPVHQRVVRDTFTIEHFEGAPTAAEAPVRVEHFDARERLVRIDERRDGATTLSTVYDLALDGRISAIRDGGGMPVTRYTIAGVADPVRIEHRDVGGRTYYHDAANRLVERVDPDGSALFYSYDALGRLTRIEHNAAAGGARTTVRELIYDEDPDGASAGRNLQGRIALVRDAGNAFRYSYNRAGLIVRDEVTAAGGTLVTRREYDLQGTPTAVVYPDGHRMTTTLDDSGSVSTIDGVLTEVAYDADGSITDWRFDNGVRARYARDTVSRRLTEIAATGADGTVLRRVRYGHDDVGNIVGLVDERPGSTEHQIFGYDGLHRLTSQEVRADDAEGAVLRSGAYRYDGEGNLLELGEGSGLALDYTDPARPGRLTRITSAAGAAPQVPGYDAAGRTTALGDLATIEYDPLDRLVRGVRVDGTELRFAYDMQNRRIVKEVTTGGATTRVRYATGLFEQHETHGIRNVFLGKRLVASVRVAPAAPPAPLYYFSDHHGTLLHATDAAGATVHDQRYEPFGSALDPSVDLDRYLGRTRDSETGLLHLGARHYAPALGRFLTPDWFVLENPDRAARIPTSLNLYAYAVDNPLVFRDPTGLWFGIDDLIVAAVGFVVGFVSGLIYGLANGQGWGSLLTALETGLTTAAGAWLGWNTGMLVGGPVGAVIGASMGGFNGLVSGMHGIYDWTSASGWFSFLSDSTWSLLGTSLGNVVHVINIFYSDSKYRDDLSRRQNRHVYEGGFALKSDFAFTQGNVISNAGLGTGSVNTSFIAQHEELHIWQQRFFGPIFQVTYVAWAVGGFLAASGYWLFNTDQSYGSLLETAAYYDNPFEYWAYNNDSNWPPSGINSSLAWS
ncbi:SpvB/TcaC N-terminal domain-containing protein [uncultured Pseudonocardia sp.]|uniref:SpvB/TcaC N-terminal domain-containing protein n=1 Tax=uncultured Pseudonocardia sp. TaxID=211455 RepID=UPI002602AA77|nr:SpvB/TcaC N-terminal domain-containing protein [uncultured Pseudonocardia sp.]